MTQDPTPSTEAGPHETSDPSDTAAPAPDQAPPPPDSEAIARHRAAQSDYATSAAMVKDILEAGPDGEHPGPPPSSRFSSPGNDPGTAPADSAAEKEPPPPPPKATDPQAPLTADLFPSPTPPKKKWFRRPK